MPLLRIAFWLVIIILLLPSSRDQHEGTFAIASAAVKDVGRFCDRNPETCERGRAAFDHFLDKAKTGGLALVDFIKDRVSARYANSGDGESWDWGDDSAQRQRTGRAPAASWFRRSDHTLTEQDLEPTWLAPGAGADV